MLNCSLFVRVFNRRVDIICQVIIADHLIENAVGMLCKSHIVDCFSFVTNVQIYRKFLNLPTIRGFF